MGGRVLWCCGVVVVVCGCVWWCVVVCCVCCVSLCVVVVVCVVLLCVVVVLLCDVVVLCCVVVCGVFLWGGREGGEEGETIELIAYELHPGR